MPARQFLNEGVNLFSLRPLARHQNVGVRTIQCTGPWTTILFVHQLFPRLIGFRPAARQLFIKSSHCRTRRQLSGTLPLTKALIDSRGAVFSCARLTVPNAEIKTQRKYPFRFQRCRRFKAATYADTQHLPPCPGLAPGTPQTPSRDTSCALPASSEGQYLEMLPDNPWNKPV